MKKKGRSQRLEKNQPQGERYVAAALVLGGGREVLAWLGLTPDHGGPRVGPSLAQGGGMDMYGILRPSFIVACSSSSSLHSVSCGHTKMVSVQREWRCA